MKVLVIGGGPAGATCGALLAKHGVEVTVAERERFPRHHVGESLQPASFALLHEHFGLGPTIAEQGFARKYGAVYVWGETRDPWTVLFDERLERDLPGLDEAGLLAGGYEHAWQVDRARLDEILLDEAARRGATVLQEVEVGAPRLDGDRVVGVRVGDEERAPDVVVDCSGQRCLLGRALGLQEPVADLQATATYTYFDGAGGTPGPLARHVQLVVTLPDGWAWFIPISATRTSVGVVVRERARLDEARFAALLDQSGLPLAGASRKGPLRFARDWSYATRRVAGANWLLAGDAAGFVDPILSGGVDAAIRGGANAAVAVLSMRSGDPVRTHAATVAYDTHARREHAAYLDLARYWYGNNRSVDGFFWEAHRHLPPGSAATPLRAFVYLTSGRYAADRHFKVFAEWQEQKMFRELGVDRSALKSSLRAREP